MLLCYHSKTSPSLTAALMGSGTCPPLSAPLLLLLLLLLAPGSTCCTASATGSNVSAKALKGLAAVRAVQTKATAVAGGRQPVMLGVVAAPYRA
jgi:hypothetical protein